MEILLYRYREGSRYRENFFLVVNGDRVLGRIELPKRSYRGHRGTVEIDVLGRRVPVTYRREILDGFTAITARVHLEERVDLLEVIASDGGVSARLHRGGTVRDLEVSRDRQGRPYIRLGGGNLYLTRLTRRPGVRKTRAKSGIPSRNRRGRPIRRRGGTAQEDPPVPSVIVGKDAVEILNAPRTAEPLLRHARFLSIGGRWVLFRPERANTWPPWSTINWVIYELKRRGFEVKVNVRDLGTG